METALRCFCGECRQPATHRRRVGAEPCQESPPEDKSRESVWDLNVDGDQTMVLERVLLFFSSDPGVLQNGGVVQYGEGTREIDRVSAWREKNGCPWVSATKGGAGGVGRSTHNTRSIPCPPLGARSAAEEVAGAPGDRTSGGERGAADSPPPSHG